MKSFTKPLLKLLLLGVTIIVVLLIVDRKEKGVLSQKKELVLIQYNDSPLSELSQEGILQGLSQIGLTRGTDYELKISNAQGDIATLNMMLDAAITDQPDLIFVTSTPTLQAAIKKIKDIPVVFSVVADPLVAGAGTSFTDHLPNVTGISTLGDYEGMVRWVQIVLPNTKTIGTLYSPGEANSVKNMTEMKNFVEKAGMQLMAVPVNSSAEVVDAAMAMAAQRPDVICQIIDNLTSGAFAGVAKISRDHKIPLFGFVSDQAEKGAILVVSRNYIQAGIDAALLAKKILDGTSPSAIPFEFVSKTDLLINTEAAAYYGVTLPAEVLNSKNLIKVK